MVKRGRPKKIDEAKKVTLASEDIVPCEKCGQEIFIHNGNVFCCEDCLMEELEDEKEEEDLVEKWRAEHGI